MTSIANASIFEEMVCTPERVKEKNIYRAPHDRENPYTLITNKLLRDTTIKHSDRGLMCQLLSWSDFHNLCIQAVVKKSVEGRDAIRGMIDRLITAGYIRMIQTKDSQGQFDKVTYQIFEQSTGAVVADLDLAGMLNNTEFEQSPQLDLFCVDVDNVENDMKNENMNQPATGFSVSGKAETNNNYDSRNTNLSNNGQSENSGNQKENIAEILNKWPLQIEDNDFRSRASMAGIYHRLQNQEQLNRYLIDFNQQHEKYKHLNHTQRVKNFVVYLVQVFGTVKEHNKHVARMKALGFAISFASSANPSKKQNQRIQNHQTGCNPFEVQEPQTPIVLSEAFQAEIEGF